MAGRRRLFHWGLPGLLLLLSGCTHHVAFDDIDYTVDQEPREEPTEVVITEEQRSAEVPVRSGMAGFAHSWVAFPGEMLVQVAEVEMPQVFSDSQLVTEPSGAEDRYQLFLEVPYYSFSNHRATVRMRAELLDADKEQLLDQTYENQGDTYGARMFWGGAFGMKSAMRNSSLEAYQANFEQLRADLEEALDE